MITVKSNNPIKQIPTIVKKIETSPTFMDTHINSSRKYCTWYY